MAYEYQTGEDRLPVGGIGEQLPTELSAAYFQNLDRLMARQEAKQMERTLGDLGDRGFLRSGDTFSRVAEDVLGPAQERRNAILLPEMQRAAGQGREERLGGVAFNRQKEMASLQNQYRLEEIQAQANVQKMLLELEASLQPDTGGFDWGQIGGQALGIAAGGIFGGVGAGIGGRIAGGMAQAGTQTMLDRYSTGANGPKGDYGQYERG